MKRMTENDPSSIWSFYNAIYLYALNAPGTTVMYPNTLPNSLSRIFDILYSNFCAASWGLIRKCPYVHFGTTISPHAPPTFPLMSKAF